MPRRATVKLVSLKSCLVNLPLSIYGPLVEHQVRPQSLAVHLTHHSNGTLDEKSKPKTAYVGWTGMAAASSLALWNNPSARDAQLETIEIDPQYAQALGFAENDVVDIGLLHDLPQATSVSTEPITADDWEILELHAEYVENNLLSQVRIAAVGQEVDVWIFGRTRIRFRVVSCEPSAPASILTTDTEVVIAPKTRGKPTSSPKSGAKAKSKSKAPDLTIDVPNESSSKATPISSARPTFRILPSRCCPASLTLNGQRTTVWVSPSGYSAITGSKANGKNATDPLVMLKRLKAPIDPSNAISSSPPSDTSSPSAKVLHSHSHTSSVTSDDKKSQTPKNVCRLRISSDVPERHVCVVLGSLGEVDGAEDWDIVSMTVVSDKDKPPLEKERAPGSALPFAPPPPQNAPTGDTLAGVDDILSQAKSFLKRGFALQAQAGSTASGPRQTPALLLCGAPGSGRTSVAREVVRQLELDPTVLAYSLYVDLSKHAEARVGTMRTNLQYWLDKAAWHRPAVLVLDNLDRAVGPEVEHADSSRQRQIAELFVSIFASPRVPQGVTILATCQNQTTLHPLLSTSHIFSSRLTLKAPNKDARRDILSRVIQDRLASSDIRQDPSHPLNFTALATQTDGYSATDLRDLVGRAVHQAVIRCSKEPNPPILLSEDFVTAQVDFTPLSLRDVKLQKSEVQWADIGGLHETRRVLRETLEWPTKYGAIFAKCPLRLRSGLLLYGFPGCGKTLLASAVAKECGVNFISVKGPELLNKYIGASEKSVRDIFERAQAAKPCVLFFDEFDSIAPKRGHDSTGVTDRVVNQMLTQMDGAEGLEGVYVLAATSRPDLIDPALLRPGRLDKSLLCNMPDEQERYEILQALSRKIELAGSVDLHNIAQETDGYSGADLQAIIYNAHLDVVHEAIERAESSSSENQVNGVSTSTDEIKFTAFGGVSGQTILSRAEEAVLMRRLETMLNSSNKIKKTVATVSKPKHVVEVHHLQQALRSTRPSVPPEERVRLEKIYGAFVSERSGQLPVPPEGMAVGTRESLG